MIYTYVFSSCEKSKPRNIFSHHSLSQSTFGKKSLVICSSYLSLTLNLRSIWIISTYGILWERCMNIVALNWLLEIRIWSDYVSLVLLILVVIICSSNLLAIVSSALNQVIDFSFENVANLLEETFSVMENVIFIFHKG